jgi:hypothetical protein
MPWSFAVECWKLNEFDCFNFIDFHCLFLTWIHHDTSIVYNFLTAGELTVSWGFHFLGLIYGLTYIDIMRYILFTPGRGSTVPIWFTKIWNYPKSHTSVRLLLMD